MKFEMYVRKSGAFSIFTHFCVCFGIIYCQHNREKEYPIIVDNSERMKHEFYEMDCALLRLLPRLKTYKDYNCHNCPVWMKGYLDHTLQFQISIKNRYKGLLFRQPIMQAISVESDKNERFSAFVPNQTPVTK